MSIHERIFEDKPELEAAFYAAFLEVKPAWPWRLLGRLNCLVSGHYWYRFFNFRQCLACYTKEQEKP